MTGTEEFIRAVYRMTEGTVRDVEGWRNAFTADGVFNVVGRESYTGEQLGDVITTIAAMLPDVHRELLRVNVMDDVIAVETMTHGTHLGPFPTPAGPIPPTGATISVPSADLIYLRDGRIKTFNTYLMQNIWLSQLGISPDFAAALSR
jgi:hypothetical protein